MRRNLEIKKMKGKKLQIRLLRRYKWPVFEISVKLRTFLYPYRPIGRKNVEPV
jgi:hypothetical protein